MTTPPRSNAHADTRARPQPERLLPQNLEAEMGVLGSILIDPDALEALADFLRPDDFYRDAHRTIYETMLALHERRAPVDFLTLCDALASRQYLEQVGGEASIIALVNGVPTSCHAQAYGRVVERTSTMRRLIHAAGKIAALAYANPDETTPVLEQAEQLIFGLTQSAVYLGTDASLATLLSQYTAILDERAALRGQLVGVPSGFAGLDRLTGGFRASDLLVLAARPSMGKTSCALSMALTAALRFGKRVGIFSLEMSQEQLLERFLAMESGLNLQRITTGNLEDAQWERLIEAMDRLAGATIRIDGTSTLSPVQLRSRARRWVQHERIDFIIVDYLQLLQPDELPRGNGTYRAQVIDEISRSLKLLAHELRIPILVLAQLSRAVELRTCKIPMLSDLRESGGIENTADVVLFIYRDEVYHPDSARKGYADLLVAKQRNGPLGQAAVRFDPTTTTFCDPEEGITLPPLEMP